MDDPIETQMAARFLRDTARHELTVLRDDGLYRHLRLRASRSFAWFELVTWPGALTIRGDMGSYTFSRDPDMFDFFRRSSWQGAPNFQYWDEKVDAADRCGVREYSEDELRRHITEDVSAHAEADLDGRLRACAKKLGTIPARLPEDAAAACRAAHADYMDGLREELDGELLGDYPAYCLQDEHDAIAGVRQFSYRLDGAPASEQPFGFDTSDWRLDTYSAQYLWCCHAVLLGIRLYDRARRADRHRATRRRIRDARHHAMGRTR